ncbi:GNAT family N-acetyltransferase [Amycolatopsis sp. FDAARGOS 1241]|uniref:GNAT family N-acetyltransferase n=1 Tax=Amycolatopsis sp. FDAARGOS 1241 TaxID=2778070 RepID=UPI00194F3E5B|nr:GNAT family N-acetyltransferase [Amycolatopsis sp. FDAARGOS 1241]QRP48644.1 GNAT family N-acetyltransferase [Amycolatopsis sp. FDAARGOS 1241]
MEATAARAGSSPVQVRELEHPEADDQVVALLAHLRPDTADRAGAVAASVAQGVRYLGAFDEAGRLAGLAGWRVMSTTRGRVLYVDDLVSDPRMRRRGAGRALLAWLERAGAARGCRTLELDSGVTRNDAHRFYAQAGLSISAFHFSRPLAGGWGIFEIERSGEHDRR